MNALEPPPASNTIRGVRFKKAAGLVIVVEPESLAEMAGIWPQDRLLEINGEPGIDSPLTPPLSGRSAGHRLGLSCSRLSPERSRSGGFEGWEGLG